MRVLAGWTDDGFADALLAEARLGPAARTALAHRDAAFQRRAAATRADDAGRASARGLERGQGARGRHRRRLAGARAQSAESRFSLRHDLVGERARLDGRAAARGLCFRRDHGCAAAARFAEPVRIQEREAPRRHRLSRREAARDGQGTPSGARRARGATSSPPRLARRAAGGASSACCRPCRSRGSSATPAVPRGTCRRLPRSSSGAPGVPAACWYARTPP